ncbi:hypothetical protein DAPPUDRAFT_103867 [Daphnia pulex]|uniref:Uncharacterized protein n=1 Tax=Daphnia pulex TaxID=6669 RepID=E9GKL4_DAPPU|nr:hypothetical protein DAPPUDRAFT_103867 [Daphnia pulex]|eukprot:EFX80011.1 hypothetical protein DAPPUDRAFT_103867 [Daphnia pulex]
MWKGSEAVTKLMKPDAYFSSLINSMLPLTCCCAQVIQQNGIPIDESQLPTSICQSISKWCWRKAMKLRYSPADGVPLLPMIPYVGVPSVASLVVFVTAEEVMTMEDLNQFEESFCVTIASQVDHGQPNALYILSLYEYVSEKIIFDKDDEDDDEEEDEDEVKDLNVIAIKRYTVMNGIGSNTFLLMLEQVTDEPPQLLPRKSFEVLINTLAFASYWLGFLAKKQPGYPGREKMLSHANLLTLTKFIGEIASFFIIEMRCLPLDFKLTWILNNPTTVSAKSFLILFSFWRKISPHLNNQVKQQIEEHFSNYIRYYSFEGTATALHVAADAFETPMLTRKTTMAEVRFTFWPKGESPIGMQTCQYSPRNSKNRLPTDHGQPHALYIFSLYEYVSENMIFDEDDENDDEDEDEDEVEDLNVIAIKRYTVMNGIGFNTFLLILEQVTDEFDPQLLPRTSFDILIKTLAFASYWLGFLAKKRPGYPGREQMLSHANLLTQTKFIGEIASFFITEMRCLPWDFKLTWILNKIPPHLNNQEKQQIEEHFLNYIRYFSFEGTATAFHVAADAIETESRILGCKLANTLLVIRRTASQADHGQPNALYILSLYEYVSENMFFDEDDENDDEDKVEDEVEDLNVIAIIALL